jgi:hypothetical protein
MDETIQALLALTVSMPAGSMPTESMQTGSMPTGNLAVMRI